MSRRKKRRPPRQRTGAAVSHQPRSPTGNKPSPSSVARFLQAIDGYYNPLARLGEASALLAAGGYVRSSLTAAPRLLTVLYRENWLAKRIIDMPSEDMTRGWYTLPPELGPDQLDALRRLEARHEIRREITAAIRWARLYGGCCALMVLEGQEDRLDTPLDPDEIVPGSFRGLLVRDRLSVTPSEELETDINDPDFGYPLYYDLQPDETGADTLRVHHSRLLRFVGRELPRQEEIAESFWGASELEHIWEELQKRNATSANIAQLVFQANITTLRMSDFGDVLAMGTDEQKAQVLSALEQENAMRTSFGLQLMSAGDTLETHPYSFSGLSEVYEAFMLDMAGAAGIPATRLFGRSPAGMNATGESDLKNYYELIAEMQERHLRPALEKLLPVMALSLWGHVPPRLEPSFPPLVTASPLEQAEVLSRQVDTLARAAEAGFITPDEARNRLRQLGIV